MNKYVYKLGSNRYPFIFGTSYCFFHSFLSSFSVVTFDSVLDIKFSKRPKHTYGKTKKMNKMEEGKCRREKGKLKIENGNKIHKKYQEIHSFFLYYYCVCNMCANEKQRKEQMKEEAKK